MVRYLHKKRTLRIGVCDVALFDVEFMMILGVSLHIILRQMQSHPMSIDNCGVGILSSPCINLASVYLVSAIAP